MSVPGFRLIPRWRERLRLMAEERGRGVRLGFRIEFWERADDDHRGKLAGDAYCEDAYLATTLPRVGELVSSGIIAGYEAGGRVLPPWLPVPFLRVASVEHYPELLEASVPGGTPPGAPGVQVVFRVQPPGDVVARDDLERLLTGLGWTVSWHPDLDVPNN
jgi:hypothetical protein